MKNIFTAFICLSIILCAFTTVSDSQDNTQQIEYTVLYQGFITCVELEDPIPPYYTLIFTSQKNWMDFSRKYFFGLNSIIALFNDSNINNFIDFEKEGIVFRSTIGAKPTYGISYDIKGVIKKDDELKLSIEKNKHFSIFNDIGIVHPFLCIVKVNNKYITDDLTNIYKPEEQ